MNKENIQQKYIELQFLSRQLNVLNQQIQLITNKIEELQLISQGLDEIITLKKGHELLIPVGSGILLKAAIKNNDEFFMNVGANIVTKKSYSESKKIIESQIVHLEFSLEETEKEIMSISSDIDLVRKELSSPDD